MRTLQLSGLRSWSLPRASCAVAATLWCLSAPGAFASEAKLTGDLFVTMQSGDVKRGADVLVAVVPASRAFLDEWEHVQAGYEQEVAPIAAEYDALEAQRKSLMTTDYRDLRVSLQRSQQAGQVLNQMFDIGRSRWAPLQDLTTRVTMRSVLQTQGDSRPRSCPVVSLVPPRVIDVMLPAMVLSGQRVTR
jgi:hypothetical protein